MRSAASSPRGRRSASGPRAAAGGFAGRERREHAGRGSFNVVDLFRQCREPGMLAQLSKDREAQAGLRQIEARVVELLPIRSTAEYKGGEVA